MHSDIKDQEGEMDTPGEHTQSRAALTGTIATGTLALVAGLAIVNWFQAPPRVSITTRMPFMDGTDAAPSTTDADETDLEGTFTRIGDPPASVLPGAWPGFRGTTRDNIAHDSPPLLDAFPDSGPPVIWRRALGEGYAGAAVRNSRVYVLDYDENEKADTLRCFDLSDGHEIWRRAYRVHVKRNHGMSRTVPAVTDEAVISLGPKCHVLCVAPLDGAFRWGIDLVADYGSEVPLWYAGQCPLVDGKTTVLAPAGPDTLMIGVDTETGAVTWRTPNPRSLKMSHAGIMPMTLAGRRMYVYPAVGGLVGIAADGPDLGALLWETREWTASVLAPTPVQIGDNRLLVTAGYGSGSAIFDVREDSGIYSIHTVNTLKKTEFACEQHTPILFRSRLYTIIPSDGGAMKRQLVCADLDGRTIWNSGKTDRFGLGPFLMADEKLWVLDDDGVLSLISASTSSYTLLGRAQVLTGAESWAPMAMAGTRLLLRDSKEMICLDVGADSGSET